jgi:PAS domain-containing protein
VAESGTQRRCSAGRFLQVYRQIFAIAGQGILITTTKLKNLAVNKTSTILTGYPAHQVIGQTPRLLKSDRQDDALTGLP